MNKGSWGKVRAFFDLMTDEGFTIKGFKIIEGINGLFVGVPSQKGKDDEYFDTVFIAPELREELNHLALQTYGMDDSSKDNFDFPKKEEVSATQETQERVSDEPEKPELKDEEEKVTYSDDDIPF